MNKTARQQLDQAEKNALLEQAVDWMVNLASGNVCAHDKQLFSVWLAQSAAHQSAWQHISQSLVMPVHALKQLPANQSKGIEQALLRPNSRREFLRNSFSFAAVSLTLAGIINRYHPLSGLSADIATGTGERFTKNLADGSKVLLNARTHIDVNVLVNNPLNANKAQRSLTLHQGEIQLFAAENQAVPFNVYCKHAKVTTLNSHCLVKKQTNNTFVLALSGELTINLSNDAKQAVTLKQGEAIYFNEYRFQTKQTGLQHKAQWSQGLHLAKNETLLSLSQSLADYYPGYIRVAANAQQLKVYGGYPLDDLDKTFATLAQTLPIKIRQLGPLITLIEAA